MDGNMQLRCAEQEGPLAANGLRCSIHCGWVKRAWRMTSFATGISAVIGGDDFEDFARPWVDQILTMTRPSRTPRVSSWDSRWGRLIRGAPADGGNT